MKKRVMFMQNRVIVTISRQYGSAGSIVGKKLAEKLGIAFYDRQFLEEITKKLGVSSAFFTDENRADNGLYEVGSKLMRHSLANVTSLSVNLEVYEEAARLIREIARRDSAVIVGRCADYVLKDEERILPVFIYADKKDRLYRGIHEYRLDPKQAEDMLYRFDRKRANFYEFYTDRKWGAVSNYALMMNTSRLGVEQCVDYLAKIVRQMQQEEPKKKQ